MSILKMLGEFDEPRGRIVSFELSDDKRAITLEECCDNYFRTDLTKSEFWQMIEELKALHAQMLD